MPLISSRLPRPPKRSSPGLPLDQWGDDAGQELDGPVQLDRHPAVFAQGLVVPRGGCQIHNGHCSAVDGHCNSYVLNDPGGHGRGSHWPQFATCDPGCLLPPWPTIGSP